MPSTLKLEIVTPEAIAYSEQVDMVVLPGAAGELGVLAGHEPLMTTIVPGELRVIKDGEETVMAIGSGFAFLLDGFLHRGIELRYRRRRHALSDGDRLALRERDDDAGVSDLLHRPFP